MRRYGHIFYNMKHELNKRFKNSAIKFTVTKNKKRVENASRNQ